MKKPKIEDLLRGLPTTAGVEDLEAKRVLDAYRGTLLRIIAWLDQTDKQETKKDVRQLDTTLKLIEGANIKIDRLPNQYRRISATGSRGGNQGQSAMVDGDMSIVRTGSKVHFVNDEDNPGANHFYGTLDGAKGWHETAEVTVATSPSYNDSTGVFSYIPATLRVFVSSLGDAVTVFTAETC